ncbi:MAG: hypothetical protein AB1757_14825 [Acidobacteriota bacterium]
MENGESVSEANPLYARVLRVIWGVLFFWLALAAIWILYCLIWWINDSANPGRYEIAIIAAIILFYSSPAAIGVLITGLLPKTGLSTKWRIRGIALLLFCISTFMLLDYLQVKYR